MSENQPLTPQEVADTLRIAKNTVYELVKRGELKAYKVGNKFRFNARDIAAYQNQSSNQAHAGNTAPALTGSYGNQLPLPSDHQIKPYLQSEPATESPGFVLCGQDVLLDLLAQRMEAHPAGGRVYRSYLGSYNGLYALYQGTVHAASAHLWDGLTNSYNLPFLPYVLPGTALTVIHLACRSVGFYVTKGNPKGIAGWDDLKRTDISFVNRERGSGMRVLLDERLRLAGIAQDRLAGYQRICTTHLAAAATVARQGGDFALGSEKAGRQVNGIDFIPLQQERYELVFQLADAGKPLFRAMTEIIQSTVFRQELEGMGGYDTRDTGKIMSR